MGLSRLTSRSAGRSAVLVMMFLLERVLLVAGCASADERGRVGVGLDDAGVVASAEPGGSGSEVAPACGVEHGRLGARAPGGVGDEPGVLHEDVDLAGDLDVGVAEHARPAV